MKLCINCKHYQAEFSGTWHRCKRGSTTVVNPVTGTPLIMTSDCVEERANNWPMQEKHCGPDGQFFEEKV